MNIIRRRVCSHYQNKKNTLSMLFGILGADLLGNVLSIKGTVGATIFFLNHLLTKKTKKTKSWKHICWI